MGTVRSTYIMHRFVGCSTQIKESLPNSISLLEKKDIFNYMRECLETICLACELLGMIRQGMSHGWGLGAMT
jgi:hypothetical protein